MFRTDLRRSPPQEPKSDREKWECVLPIHAWVSNGCIKELTLCETWGISEFLTWNFIIFSRSRSRSDDIQEKMDLLPWKTVLGKLGDMWPDLQPDVNSSSQLTISCADPHHVPTEQNRVKTFVNMLEFYSSITVIGLLALPCCAITHDPQADRQAGFWNFTRTRIQAGWEGWVGFVRLN